MKNEVKPEDLQVGLLVWWKADRYMKSWSVPGIVTYVNHEENKYKVYTFDDMKETSELSIIRESSGCCNSDPSSLTEMTTTDKQTLVDYIKQKETSTREKIENFKTSITKLEQDLVSNAELINQIEDNDILSHILKPKVTILK